MMKTASAVGFHTLFAAGVVLAGVWSGTGPQNGAGRMPLAPLSGGAPGGFSFLVYGDVQQSYQDGHRALVEQMLAEDADIVFNTGGVPGKDSRNVPALHEPLGPVRSAGQRQPAGAEGQLPRAVGSSILYRFCTELPPARDERISPVTSAGSLHPT